MTKVRIVVPFGGYQLEKGKDRAVQGTKKFNASYEHVSLSCMLESFAHRLYLHKHEGKEAKQINCPIFIK